MNNFHTHPVNRTDNWITPKPIVRSLGQFDLDPATPVIMPWRTASRRFTIETDGLKQNWFGRVWLNPPYRKGLIDLFMERMAQHNNGIALLFTRTETAFWHEYIWPFAASMLFVRKRIHFCYPDGTPAADRANAASVLISYGKDNIDALNECGIDGKHVLVNYAPVFMIGVSTGLDGKQWRSVVDVALTRLGEADLSQIYTMVEKLAPVKTANSKHYKAKVRQQLQYYFKRIEKGRYAA